MKILFADDQPIVLKSVATQLEKAGYTLFKAENGAQAVALYDEHSPDFVIMDLNMPVMTGFEAIEHIRKVRGHMKVPIIMMSGDDDEETIVDAFTLGVDDYIEKPVGYKELLVRIRRLLGETSASSKKSDSSADSQSTKIQRNLVGVVIPCYNEEDRLKTADFLDFVKENTGYFLCFVNDGSKDKTLEMLENLRKGREDHIRIIDCKVNGGKAEAVRQGVLSLAKDKQFDYIGYLDADLSTNFEDFHDLTETIAMGHCKIVSGSRISRMGANITKESSRQIISKTINLIIRQILGMSFQDTQCGAKVMVREVALNMFNTPFLTRWLFDVEIFLRMKRYYGKDAVKTLICEQPLKRWVHEDGSKLSMKDSLKIVGQLLQIAIHYR